MVAHLFKEVLAADGIESVAKIYLEKYLILVPFVGACVHVPPPPANQLVFVTTQNPYESTGLYEAVNVIGMFGTASTYTQLADVAYALSADRIEPF